MAEMGRQALVDCNRGLRDCQIKSETPHFFSLTIPEGCFPQV